jgi:hypothetical protein
MYPQPDIASTLRDSKPLASHDEAEKRLINPRLSLVHVGMVVEVQGDDEAKHAPHREQMIITRAGRTQGMDTGLRGKVVIITAELTKLAESGLIEQVKHEADGRRITLSLTPDGLKVYKRLGEDLSSFLAKRLAGYSRGEILLCARLLTDFSKEE